MLIRRLVPFPLLAVFSLTAACSDDKETADAATATPDAAVPDAAQPDALISQVVTFQGFTVSAAGPEVSSDGSMITGSFTFGRISGGETRGGGACLVADLYNSTPCTTEADCASLQLPAGGFHYCVGVNGGATKTCWTRPSAEPCTRAPMRTPGTYTTMPTASRVGNKATTWMTLACLAADGQPMGCASSEAESHIYATGPTLVVPAP
jgi:hypothetical protein